MELFTKDYNFAKATYDRLNKSINEEERSPYQNEMRQINVLKPIMETYRTMLGNVKLSLENS